MGSTPEAPDTKRAKLEAPASGPDAILAGFDFAVLPATLVTELIVANLQAFSEVELIALVQAYRQRNDAASASVPADLQAQQEPPTTLSPDTGATAELSAADPPLPTLPTPVPEGVQASSRSKSPSVPLPVKQEEPVDPLAMNIDDEIEYEPDKLNLEVGIERYCNLHIYF